MKNQMILEAYNPDVLTSIEYWQDGVSDIIETNCHLVISAYSNKDFILGDRARNILGFVLDDGHIVPAFDVRKTYPRDLRPQIDNYRFFGKFTLAYNLEDEMLPEIKTFDTIKEVKDFLNLHKVPQRDIENFEYYVKNGLIITAYSTTFDDKKAMINFDAQSHFKNRNDMFDNYFEIKFLDNTYSGLRYNGLDYNCNRVLCGKNDIQGQILGFICGDGDIIDINDPLLDGIYLIEGDESKKGNLQYLISPGEVEPPYKDSDFDNFENGENANSDIAEQHAFGRYIAVINEKNIDGYGAPKIHTFTTHNDMFAFLEQKLEYQKAITIDKSEVKLLEQEKNKILRYVPESAGYGYDARYAPEKIQDEITAVDFTNSPYGKEHGRNLLTMLVNQNSLFWLDAKSKAELVAFEQDQSEETLEVHNKETTKIHRRAK